MGIEQATRVTVQEVMDDVHGQVNGIIPMNPNMDEKLNSIKSKIGEHMRPRLRDICAFLELKDASKDVKSNDFNRARTLVRRIRDAIQGDIRDFKKRPTDTKRSYYVGQKSITVDDNSKKAPSNTKMHRNDNEVALHMTLTQHLKGMDSLNSALGHLKQEESEYLAQMTDHVQDGHAESFDDALTEQAIMAALQQDSLELAQPAAPQSAEPITQTETKKVSFVDNQDVATPKEPVKSAHAIAPQVSSQPVSAPSSSSQVPATETYDPYNDPINGPAILAAMAGEDMPKVSQQETQQTPAAPVKVPVNEDTEKAVENTQAELPPPQWGSAPQWGFSQANQTDKAPTKPAKKEVEDKSQLEQSTQDQKGGYVLGTGKKVGTGKSSSSEPVAQSTVSEGQQAAHKGKAAIPSAQPKKTQQSKFMSFSDIKGKDGSPEGAGSSKSAKKKGPMDELKGLENIHKYLIDHGFKLHYVSGEGAHCGSRSLMIALMAHFKSLDEDRGNDFLSEMKSVMKKPQDRVKIDSMFRAAKKDMGNALQVGHSQGLDIVRLRLPTEKSYFTFGQHNDFATDGERVVKIFLTELANSGRLDKTSKDDLLRSINSPKAYMLAETIAHVLTAVDAHSGIATQNNGNFWQFGDNIEVDAPEFIHVVPHQFSSVVARMAHAHFVAYAK